MMNLCIGECPSISPFLKNNGPRHLSAISWRPILVVEEAGVPGENQRPCASNW